MIESHDWKHTQRYGNFFFSFFVPRKKKKQKLVVVWRVFVRGKLVQVFAQALTVSYRQRWAVEVGEGLVGSLGCQETPLDTSRHQKTRNFTPSFKSSTESSSKAFPATSQLLIAPWLFSTGSTRGSSVYRQPSDANVSYRHNKRQRTRVTQPAYNFHSFISAECRATSKPYTEWKAH